MVTPGPTIPVSDYHTPTPPPLKNSFMVNNSIQRSTKNSRGMKPELSIFHCFPCSQRALIASSSLLTPHCTAFTLDKSYSPRRRFRSEGVTLFALRTEPKLLAVSRPLLTKCQAGLSRWPTASFFILGICSLGT